MRFFINKIRDIIEWPDRSEVLNVIGWCLISAMIGILLAGFLCAIEHWRYWY